MAKPFSEYVFDDAIALVGQRTTSAAGQFTLIPNKRRPPSAVSATDFFNGDHWQRSKGFIGQLPPASLPGAAQIELDIKAAFVSENVIQEVTETHIGGILGREPIWKFLPEQQPGATEKPEADKKTGDSLTPWWNERKALKDLQRAAEILLLEGRAIRRLFFPKGRLAENSTITASDVPTALDFIFFETHYADVAGVFTDPDTQKQIGIFIYDEKNDRGDVITKAAELSFLNDDGDTVCKIVRDKGAPTEYPPYKLGGRLLIHEMQRRALITEQVQSNQKALNLAHTMMMRNVNLAGARERSVTNAQDPKRPKRVQNPDSPTRTIELEPGQFETGAGAVMFLMGFPIRNDKGEIVGYTNPNVSISDPAPVQTFKDTIAEQKTAIYSQVHQRHVLISGDAEASGRSREQARAEFERSLKETKTSLDDNGRWQLETALRLAAQIAGQTNTFLKLRADFNCLIDAGDVDPEKARLVMDMRKPAGPNNQPLVSDETARGMIGIDDAEAELAKIEEEAPTDAEIRKRMELMTPPQQLGNGGGAIA